MAVISLIIDPPPGGKWDAPHPCGLSPLGNEKYKKEVPIMEIYEYREMIDLLKEKIRGLEHNIDEKLKEIKRLKAEIRELKKQQE
jgi:predicted RNase H-like nuclease (RuvC/YqgF family)